MSKVPVTLNVEKEMLDLGVAVVKLLKVCSDQLKDGFQVTQDLPVIAIEALKDIPVVMANLSSVAPDWEEDKAGFLIALAAAYQQGMAT